MRKIFTLTLERWRYFLSHWIYIVARTTYNSKSIRCPKNSCGLPGTPGSKQGTVLGFVVRTPRKDVVGALPLDGTGSIEKAALVGDKPDADS